MVKLTLEARCSLAQRRFISWWVLFRKRQYVVDKIKKPLLKAITILATRYPEPTREQTLLPNTHRLLDIQDKFFECEQNPNRRALFQAVWRILIVEYEHDPYYRSRFDWVIAEIGKSGWEPNPNGCPRKGWRKDGK